MTASTTPTTRRRPERAGLRPGVGPDAAGPRAAGTHPPGSRPAGTGSGGLRPAPGIGPAAALGALALSSGVALTATSGWLITAAAFQPPILTLTVAIVLVRAFGTVRPLLRYAERIRSHDVALSRLAGQRVATYDALVPLTPARLGRQRRGDVLARVVGDLDDLAFAQVRGIVPAVAMLGTGLLAAVLAAIVLLPAALVILSFLLCCLAVAALDAALERRAQAGLLEARAQVTDLATTLTGRADELRAIGAGDQVVDRLTSAQDELRRALQREAAGRAVGTLLVPALVAGHTVAMAVLVQPWTTRGLPLPLAALLILIPAALGEVVSAIPDAAGAIARGDAARRRLDDLLQQPPAVRDPADDGAESLEPGDGVPTLTLEQVTAAWDARGTALPPTDLTLEPGEHVAVVGPNGSGKSTLLAVFARHLDPATGRYLVGDVDVADIPLDDVRALLAIVDDEPHVFASTLRENLRFARPGCTDVDLETALGVAGLESWYDALPQGLDTRLGVGGQALSGGERARLAIARAVLSRRPVLLLDEPVAHLDHPTALAVMATVRDAAYSSSVILASHRPEGLEGMDRVLAVGDSAP